MKTLSLILSLTFALIIAGCYSDATKESSDDNTAQPAPVTRPVSTRY